MKKFIFAYGSLMCPHSCARTLNRHVSYVPAILNGFQRQYNAIGQVYHSSSQTNVGARFANLIEKSQEKCLGFVFEVTDIEIENLKAREKFYDLVNISQNVDIQNIGEVFTFICSKNENIENSFVLKSYVNIMLLASHSYPDLEKQIEQEFKAISIQEILEGGFSSITGTYE